MLSRRRLLACLSLLPLGWAAAPLAHAQPTAWPTKPIRIIVAGSAGGSADLVARVIGEGLGSAVGQPVVVEAKPGGMGTIAIDSLLQSPQDGHTFMVAINSAVTELPYSMKLRFDPFKDLKPLVRLSNGGLVLVSSAELPPKNLAELVAYLKAKPGQYNYASYSPGTASHINGLQFTKAAGLDMLHVGYKGSPPGLQAVIGGQVQIMFDGLATALPLIQGGRLRAYGVVAPKRMPQLPDVPTMVEAGFPDMTHAAWLCLWTTPGVPAAVQKRVHDEVVRTLNPPATREKLLAQGIEVPATAATPDELMAMNRRDYASVGKLLRSINYKPE